MVNLLRILTLSAGLLCATLLVGNTDEVIVLSHPKESPVLTISGEIQTTNSTAGAVFDIEMLKGLTIIEVETSTIWTEGLHVFTGVSLKEIVDLVQPDAESLRATAVNDYSVDIPISDAIEGGPIIAYLMDGEEMSLREKGPLWLIYPYDQNEEYQNEVIYSRSIWQLDRIVVGD